MPETTMPEDRHTLDQVQWAQSNASVRSSRYHGIGKVHVVSSPPWRTVCGRRIAPSSMRWTNQSCDARGDYAGLTDDIYCKHCAKSDLMTRVLAERDG